MLGINRSIIGPTSRKWILFDHQIVDTYCECANQNWRSYTQIFENLKNFLGLWVFISFSIWWVWIIFSHAIQVYNGCVYSGKNCRKHLWYLMIKVHGFRQHFPINQLNDASEKDLLWICASDVRLPYAGGVSQFISAGWCPRCAGHIRMDGLSAFLVRPWNNIHRRKPTSNCCVSNVKKPKTYARQFRGPLSWLSNLAFLCHQAVQDHYPERNLAKVPRHGCCLLTKGWC